MTNKASSHAERSVVVYDGACPFCRRQIAWIRRRDVGGKFEYVPRQTEGLVERYPMLARAELSEGMRVIAPDGTVSVGADAVYEIARRLPRWRFLSPLYRLPGGRWVGRIAYRWIAANRYRLLKEPCDESCSFTESVQKGKTDG